MGQTLFISLREFFNYQDEQELKCLYQRVNSVEEYNHILKLINSKKKKIYMDTQLTKIIIRKI